MQEQKVRRLVCQLVWICVRRRRTSYLLVISQVRGMIYQSKTLCLFLMKGVMLHSPFLDNFLQTAAESSCTLFHDLTPREWHRREKIKIAVRKTAVFYCFDKVLIYSMIALL